MNKRNINLDLLRCIAAFMVVVLHVSSVYVDNNIEKINLYFTVGNFFDSITRTCVPLFIMISGAFILDNPKNKEYRIFYKKTFNRIVIPTLIWSLIYFIYSISLQVARIFIGDEVGIIDFIIPIINWIKGEPFYHLWYMYMIIGLYAITPIVIRIKDDIGEKRTLKLGWGLVFFGMIIRITSELYWPIKCIPYLGYFILGYSLKKHYTLKYEKTYKYTLGAIVSALLVFILTEVIVRKGWMNNNQLFFYGYVTPFVILGSICTFIVFLNIRYIPSYKWIDKVSINSFNIYIIHAGILSVIDLFKSKILYTLNPNPIYYIPLMSITVFGLSYIGSIIVKKITNLKFSKKLEKRIAEIML